MMQDDRIVDDANQMLDEIIILREYVQVLRKQVVVLAKEAHRDGMHRQQSSYRTCNHLICSRARAILNFTSDYNHLGE